MPIWPFNKRKPLSPSQPANDNPPNAQCSFCGRPRRHVGPMVEGPGGVYICVECVRLDHQIAEANAMQTATTNLDDASVRRSGHMHIRCYFHLQRGEGERWTAVAEHPRGILGTGGSPKEAVHNLQSKILAAIAEGFAGTGPVGVDFTNHADPSLR